MNYSTETQRYDQAEKLRNEIRPTKTYELKKQREIENYKTTTRIAPVHDHDVKFTFLGFKLTEDQFKKTGAWVTQLETQLRNEHAIKHGLTPTPTTPLGHLIASTQINQNLYELLTDESEGNEHETN